MCNEIVGVNGDEGTPVPIPNTVVKLVYGDNTWLATAREDNSTRTRNTDPLGSVFCYTYLYFQYSIPMKLRLLCISIFFLIWMEH